MRRSAALALAALSLAPTILLAQPRAVEPIPAQELVGAEESATVALADHFTGEGLTFTASSSRPALASASVAEQILTVRANAVGEEGAAVVTVTATDAEGASASSAFDVSVSPAPRVMARSWFAALLDVAKLDFPSGPDVLPLLDALPAPGIAVEPGVANLRIAHLGAAASTFRYKGDCQPTGIALRRSLVHLSVAEDVQAFDHHLRCQLDADTAHALTVEIEDGPDQRQAALAFTSAAAQVGPRLRVLQTQELSREDVNGLFGRYVEDALVDDIDSRLARWAARELVDELAKRTWRDLRSPGATHGVLAQRVSYVSRTPRGERSDALTGLVAMPNVADAGFEPRDKLVILSHATGSTPSALRFADTWFVLATMLAGRGFLVVAADNWGRGEGTSDHPETYLMGHRTAVNSLDLVRAVLADPAYRRFHGHRASGQRAAATIFGYSQGGHSAFALWLAAQTHAAPIDVRELHVGGAPFDLHRTLRGTLQTLAGRCDGNPWCRDVDESVVPYATGRILPGLLAYTQTGLTPEDVIDDDSLSADFVAGMLGTEPRFDAMKALLQLNSYTNLVGLDAIASDTAIHLYHSRYDRLVPYQNAVRLASALAPHFDVAFHRGECDSGVYEALFELVSSVGVLHAICGMEVADEVLQALR